MILIIRRRGADILTNQPMYLDRHRESIVAWVKEGLSDAVIAERVRVSPSTVRYWRERNGVKRLPRVRGSECPQSGTGEPG